MGDLGLSKETDYGSRMTVNVNFDVLHYALGFEVSFKIRAVHEPVDFVLILQGAFYGLHAGSLITQYFDVVKLVVAV